MDSIDPDDEIVNLIMEDDEETVVTVQSDVDDEESVAPDQGDRV